MGSSNAYDGVAGSALCASIPFLFSLVFPWRLCALSPQSLDLDYNIINKIKNKKCQKYAEVQAYISTLNKSKKNIKY